MTGPEFDEMAALRAIVEGTAAETGEGFFTALVANLSRAMGTMGAWVASYSAADRRLTAVSMKVRDRWVDNFVYPVDGTPCHTAVEERRMVHIPDRIVDLYRSDPSLRAVGAVSYLGIPLQDVDGAIIGQLAVLDDKPMPHEPRNQAIFSIFASRAAAELRRLRAERAVREREAQLSRLLESAMDAIVVLDDQLRVSLMNPAAERLFEYDGVPYGVEFKTLLDDDARQRLAQHANELAEPERDSKRWIGGGLSVRSSKGRVFHAEATLSHYRAIERDWFTLILRDVDERLAAEEQIRSLVRETEFLRSELHSLQTYEPIVGSSRALLAALHQVDQVAPTDATVLLLGETGTGKELFARALHGRSTRADRPLVRVNCAAIPANLIESELFGHERGAFTGATSRREGRFALADGGTLFLDEIGELGLELQPKLLRVLQEGEFEPVGSSRTRKVDVRVVAATHRNLADCVRAGTFRQDLYYRLDVFPIAIPPLRDRPEDIGLLAQTFADRFARRLGRTLAPLSEPVVARLLSHAWPGNVRELENVIERGVIAAKHGVLNLDHALPEGNPATVDPRTPVEHQILSVDELEELERANILRALDATGWKVAGDSGAAALLKMNPSTLTSRMRTLGIQRPTKK